MDCAFARTKTDSLGGPGLFRLRRMRVQISSLFRLGLCFTLLCLAAGIHAQNSSEKIPFGPLTEVDMDQLIKFGRARGFDLQSELERVYTKDEQALTRL